MSIRNPLGPICKCGKKFGHHDLSIKPKMKYACVSCGLPMKNWPELYKANGNYCHICNIRISHISSLRQKIGGAEILISRILSKIRKNTDQPGDKEKLENKVGELSSLKNNLEIEIEKCPTYCNINL